MIARSRQATRAHHAAAIFATVLLGATARSAVAATAAAQSGASRPVELVTPTGTIHGTLLQPVSPHLPRTIAVIVAGSGPTDRDGNSPLLPGANNSLRYLAEGLQAMGIASLRYDKRGVAASTASIPLESDLRFAHYVEDAAGWIRRLREQGDYDRVVVIGHSEGALVATLAAQQEPVDHLVLLAGTGRPMGEVLREQLAAQLPAPLLAQADDILLRLEGGRTVEDVPVGFLSLFRPSVQPYLISWLPIDPARELTRVAAPVLIVSGTTDIQVSAERDAAVLAAAVPTARLEIIEGMNHILKRVSGTVAEQAPTYSDPTLPVAPELLEVLEDVLTVP